jgi:HlyD family secretion protein
MNQQAPLRTIDIEHAIGITGRQSARLWLKRLAWLLLAAAFVAAALYWYQQRQQTAAIITYEVSPAAREDVVVTVSSTGTIQPITQVDVGSELSGVVRDVLVDDNSIVKTGDVLARLDTTRLNAQRLKAQAQLQASEARLATANASLNQAQQAFSRQGTLRKRGLSTGQELETATAEFNRARATIDAANADIATAKADLSLVDADIAKADIISPINGMVLKRTVEPGQTVAASLQAPVLFTIAQDLTRIQLEAAVDEADIGIVKVGQTATFAVDAYRQRTFPAKIERMSFSPETLDGVVTYKTILSAGNEDLSLRPGMTATARIIVAEHKNVLAVPNEVFRYTPPVAQPSTGFSVTQMFMPRFPRTVPQRRVAADADGRRTIYVLVNNEPKEVKVKTGDSDGKKTIVIEGDLKDGESLITSSRTGSQPAAGR